MAKFRDLDEFFDDTLPLPIGGKTYRVPPPDADTGLLCQRLMTAGIAAANGKEIDAAQLDDAGEVDLYQRVLGSVYSELRADGVSWPRLKHAGVTAFLWIAGDAEAAAKYWDAGPEADAPTAGAVTSTPSRGSTSGTSRTRPTKAAAKRSAGTTS
ncbi:hypothetical protein ABZ815_20180 [Nonomuraea sp. NPDC047529]|uniref:DUF7426 family protein n=1 Tax=Nonomuraea sp. NPDC047529 TaxID=3155623 RepID=UPI0033E30B9A